MKCVSCWADGEGEAIYPYDDGKVTQRKPSPKLLCIEAQPTLTGEFRLLMLCHSCYHRLEGDNGPDMWTAQTAYEALEPKTPFSELPVTQYTRPDGTVGEHVTGAVPIWEPAHYQKDKLK